MQLARDLQSDFYPHFQEFFSILVSVCNVQDADLIQVCVCVCVWGGGGGGEGGRCVWRKVCVWGGGNFCKVKYYNVYAVQVLYTKLSHPLL